MADTEAMLTGAKVPMKTQAVTLERVSKFMEAILTMNGDDAETKTIADCWKSSLMKTLWRVFFLPHNTQKNFLDLTDDDCVVFTIDVVMKLAIQIGDLPTSSKKLVKTVYVQQYDVLHVMRTDEGLAASLGPIITDRPLRDGSLLLTVLVALIDKVKHTVTLMAGKARPSDKAANRAQMQ